MQHTSFESRSNLSSAIYKTRCSTINVVKDVYFFLLQVFTQRNVPSWVGQKRKERGVSDFSHSFFRNLRPNSKEKSVLVPWNFSFPLSFSFPMLLLLWWTGILIITGKSGITMSYATEIELDTWVVVGFNFSALYWWENAVSHRSPFSRSTPR